MRRSLRSALAAMTTLLALAIPVHQASAQYRPWTGTNGPEGGSVTALAADPHGNIYAGTTFGGIFRSTDDGTTWTRTSAPFSFGNVASLAIASDGSIYTVTSEESVWGSIDEGTTWTQLHEPIQNSGMASIAIGTDGTILFGTDWGALYRSSDKGLTWSVVGSVVDITVITPAPDGRLYLGAATGWYNGTINRSTDGGNSWVQLHRRPISEAITGIVVFGDLLVAGTEQSGILRSTDDGATWQQSNDGLANLGITKLMATRSSSIVAVTQGGLAVSRDSGQHWEPMLWPSALPYPTILLERKNGLLLGGTAKVGILTMTAPGKWQPNNRGLYATETSSLIVLPGGTIIAGSTMGEIFISSHNGTTWTNSTPPTDIRRNTTIARLRSGTLLETSVFRVLRSLDGGVSWDTTQLMQDPIMAFTVSPSDESLIGLQSNEFYHSTDEGSSWKRLTFMPGRLGEQVSAAMFISDHDLVIGTRAGGMYRATMIDDTIHVTSTALRTSIVTIAVSPDSLILYASGEGTGIFSSFDNGATWSPVSTQPDEKVTSLLVKRGGEIIAGTWAHGLWRSTDGGTTWISNSEGLFNLPIGAIAIDSAGNLLLGTFGAAVYSNALPTSVPTADGERSSGITSATLTPIPCRDRVTLRFTLSEAHDVRITIADAVGTTVFATDLRNVQAGEQTQDLDLSSLPGGDYLCSIATSRGRSTLKLVTVR